MDIAVAGAGFVGVVHSAVLSNQDHKVILFDINEERIKNMKDFCERQTKKIHIHEPGLHELLIRGYEKGKLIFTTNGEEAIRQSEVIFSCVGTPSDGVGKTDLRYVDSVAHMVGKILKDDSKYRLLINKSTVPVGTAKRVKNIILEYYTGEFDVASNPETLAQGRAVRDSTMPKRVIVGCDSDRAKKILYRIYSPFFLPQQEKIYFMSPESAELTKYACNAYLASQVVLTNIFANLAKKVGANWRDAVPAILDDIRIGKFVHPGPGFGGSCFDKDMSQLFHSIKEFSGDEEDCIVLNNILSQNRNQKLIVNKQIEKIFGTDLSNYVFAVWGLSFKRETNDTRFSASLFVVPDLLKKGAEVRVHDPEASELFFKDMQRMGVDTSKLIICNEKYESINQADALIILNDWKTYKFPDFMDLEEKMRRRIIFDGKDLLDYSIINKEVNFDYYPVGRPTVLRAK